MRQRNGKCHVNGMKRLRMAVRSETKRKRRGGGGGGSGGCVVKVGEEFSKGSKRILQSYERALCYTCIQRLVDSKKKTEIP